VPLLPDAIRRPRCCPDPHILFLAAVCCGPNGHRVGRWKLHGFWYAFGTHDGYNLWEAPDVSMAAVALAISGGGALSSFETTVLLTVDETMDALGKVGQVQYRATGG
jgi:hypothetical protein